MAYIGNKVGNVYGAMSKQDITGDGGTSYTLSYSVANANEIAVYVNNVRQEPTSAYSASGTTLTMTGNVASTDDFYVIYLGKSVGTINPPDNSVGTAKLVDTSVTNAKIVNNTIDLTSKVTGILPVANGGTGSSTSTSTLKLQTTAATTSGTEVDFMSIPSTVKRITILFRGVSQSGNDNGLVQLGTSSGLVTSGYLSMSGYGAGGVDHTDGFVYYGPSNDNVVSGIMTICTMGSNVWVYSMIGKYNTNNNTIGGGDVDLGGTLDRLRIRPAGSNTFDAGSVNIMYES